MIKSVFALDHHVELEFIPIKSHIMCHVRVSGTGY